MARKRALWALAAPVVIVLAWQVLASAGILEPLFFPAPSALLSHAWEMLGSGELLGPVQATLARLFLSFVIGSLAGLVCGLLMGALAPLRYAIEPLVSALYATPKLTLLPMLMLFFGIGNTSRVIVVATSCFILVAIHALDAVRPIDRTYVEMASNYGADKMAILRKVYLPAALPQIFTGLRLALGTGLVMTISVELVVPSDGLGSMILLAWQTFATEKLYLGVFISAALGMLFHAALRRIEGYCIPWRPPHEPE